MDMPMDKNQQTMMWQQNQYMGDSGIQSGATTQVRHIHDLSYVSGDFQNTCLYIRNL